MRRAKIVCTLGPATSSPEMIGKLIDAGMDMARLNFSHGEKETHQKTFSAVRSEAEKRGKSVAVLLDLQGPKIRVGRFENDQVELQKGAEFTITTDTSVPGNEQIVSTGYKNLTQDVHPGDAILLDDGFLTLEVVKVEGPAVVTKVIHGGTLKNNKGINLPNVNVSAPALTEKDRGDLAFGLRLGVDYIALSFVRNPEDVAEAKALAKVDGISIPVIAKIEKPQAIERLEEIVAIADGIMVARGDLGVEMGAEKVPLIQKKMIKLTNSQGKVVITATQMLESMIRNQRPTRAEASDVANAILDGTDAVMLSGETAVGDFPLETVRTMTRIITEVESSATFRSSVEAQFLDLQISANAIAHAAVIAARQMNLKAIAVVTNSGGAARLISEYRPQGRIIALCDNEVTFRRLALYWGVEPTLIAPVATMEELVSEIENRFSELKILESGEQLVITAGVPIGAGETTNMLKIHRMP